MAELWKPGWTEFDGEFYSAPRLVMEPTPSEPIPILVGGLSESPSPRGQARRLGGDVYPRPTGDRPRDPSGRGAPRRRRRGRLLGDRGPERRLPPEQFEKAEAGGVTDCWTMPWAYYHGLDCSVGRRSMRSSGSRPTCWSRFREPVAAASVPVQLLSKCTRGARPAVPHRTIEALDASVGSWSGGRAVADRLPPSRTPAHARPLRGGPAAVLDRGSLPAGSRGAVGRPGPARAAATRPPAPPP